MTLHPHHPPSPELLAAGYDRLMRALRRWLPERHQHQDREDVVQEAMLLWVTRWPQIVAGALERAHGDDDDDGLINQMISYLAITTGFEHQRRAKKARLVQATDADLLADRYGCGPTQGATADLEELLPKFYAFLDTLSENDRLALESYLREQSHAEIAAVQGIKEGDSWNHRKRAFDRLGKRGDRFRRLGEDLLAAQAGVREGHYGLDDGTASIAVRIASAGEQVLDRLLDASSLRWHRDGFVRGDVIVPAPLPTSALGLALLHAPGEPGLVPSAPFCLSVDADSRQARLAAYFGRPARRDRGRDGGLAVPADRLRLVLAG